MRSSILAIAALSLLAFAAPAFAQTNPENEDVSEAVDLAMWCGAAYTVAHTSAEAAGEDTGDLDAAASKAFDHAKTALDEDGIEAGEYDRLIDFYVSSAVEDLTSGTEDTRYTADECAELIAE